jgi:hypothetical protein
MISIETNQLEKRLLLSLSICFCYDFLVCLYGISFVLDGSLGLIAYRQTELLIVLAFDAIVILSIFLNKLKLKKIIPYFFVSVTIKSYFDMVYSDGGHVILQLILFFTSLSVLHSKKKDQLNILKFIKLMFLLTYFFSGYQKLWGIDYISGNAILKLLASPAWNFRFHEEVLQLGKAYPIIIQCIGISVLLFELFVPILFLFFEKVRAYLLCGIVLFHLSTLIVMDLVTFSVFMIVLAVGILWPDNSFNLTKRVL